MFWDQTIDRLKELRRLLRSEGRIAIAHQPRGPGATDATAGARGEKIAAALAQAGFREVRVQTLNLKPTVVCVIGMNPLNGDFSVQASDGCNHRDGCEARRYQQ